MKVHYSPQAKKELLEIIRYYDESVPGLGNEFIMELDKQIKYCCDSPEIGMLVDNEYRRLVMNRFPFNIIYRILQQEIHVMAVAHQHRKPDYWKSKANDSNNISEPVLEYARS